MVKVSLSDCWCCLGEDWCGEGDFWEERQTSEGLWGWNCGFWYWFWLYLNETPDCFTIALVFGDFTRSVGIQPFLVRFDSENL